MKVLDLRCSSDHRFEGWFGSESDYLTQSERGLVDCPLCGDHTISRLPSAPRIQVSKAKPRGPDAASATDGGDARAGRDGAAAREATPTPASSSRPAAHPNAVGAMSAADLQAGWLQAVRRVMANTVDVGARFAEEARRIHHGETAERAIRGQASREDAEALREEGIEVVAMVVPEALKGTLQ